MAQVAAMETAPVEQQPGTGLLEIQFVPWLPKDYWYCADVLFIRRDLPADKALQIIAEHLA